MRPLAATLFLLVFLAAAQGRAEGTAAYAMRGVLRGFDPATGQATVSHEAVPGYMPAMTMDFSAADPAGLQALRPGRRVFRGNAWTPQELVAEMRAAATAR